MNSNVKLIADENSAAAFRFMDEQARRCVPRANYPGRGRVFAELIRHEGTKPTAAFALCGLVLPWFNFRPHLWIYVRAVTFKALAQRLCKRVCRSRTGYDAGWHSVPYTRSLDTQGTAYRHGPL